MKKQRKIKLKSPEALSSPATKPAAKPSAKTSRKTSSKSAPPFLSTGFWLLKSEPDSYSIDDFARDRKTLWTGVRNYQARNFMTTSMRPGDRFLFYHSSADPTGVVGLGRITRVALPDPSALDVKSKSFEPKASPDHPIWFCAEVEFERKLKQPVTLETIRAEKTLAQMTLLARGQRLSVLPIKESEFERIQRLAGL